MKYKIINNKKDKWILLIHSICSNMSIFDAYIIILSQKYNIILVDLPGHGISKNYDFNNLDDVVKNIIIILDKENIINIDIWAISLGAIIATRLSEKIKNRINVMLLEGAAFGLNNNIAYIGFNIFNLLKVLLPYNLYIRLFILFIISGNNKKNIRQYFIKQLNHTNPNIIKKWLTVMNDEYKNKLIEKVNTSKTKKVIIMGEYDNIFKNGILKNISVKPQTKIIVISKASHICHMDSFINVNNLTNFD